MGSSLKEQAQKVIRKAIENREIPYGSFLVRKNRRELFYLEDGVSRDAIFRIYSMTKPITSAAVMKLLEEGELEYNDPVSKFLPGFAGQRALRGGKAVPVSRELAVRDLMNMTGGLVYGDCNSLAGCDTQNVFDEIESRLFTDHPVGTVEAMNRIGRGVLNFEPGESWDYGTSADVLGAIVEVVSGMRYGEFLERELFLPLDMNDTGFYVKEEQRHRLVTSYQISSEGSMTEYHGNHLGIINAMDRPPAYESGGAGLASTIDDYSHFADMLLCGGSYHGKQVLKERTVAFMTSPKLTEKQCAKLGWGIDYIGWNYGNLMRVMEDDRKASIIGTTGEYGWDGWLGTFFCNSPADDLTILFMTQKKDSGWLSVAKKLHNVIFSELAHV